MFPDRHDKTLLLAVFLSCSIVANVLLILSLSDLRGKVKGDAGIMLGGVPYVCEKMETGY